MNSLQHVVLIKLIDPSEIDALIADCEKLLSPIPSVMGLAVGRHADFGREDVIDDYDVGLVVAFANEADYGAYLADDRHVQLAKEWRPRWDWYRIYDFQQRPQGTTGAR
ncbi:MAG: Dabb family protein [Planctomycetota bacterium]